MAEPRRSEPRHAPKVVFLTRKFPPSVGGMQVVCGRLAREFSRGTPTRVISWGGSQAFLPWFLPTGTLKTLRAARRDGDVHVHVGDALLAPAGVLVKKLAGVSVTATVHGRDIAFDFPPYQAVVPRSLARLDGVICVSSAIAEACVARGVPRELCTVIPNGVDADEFRVETTREELESAIGRELGPRRVLVTVGRLVPKKGVEWFIREVLPRLPEDVVYLVVGEGPRREAIVAQAEAQGLRERVLLLGALAHDDRRLKVVYAGSDVFVMPNVPVAGDFEGFGVVALEAASAGLPVVAARIEGITDAVVEGETGFLVPAGSAGEFAAAILACLADGAWDADRAREVARRSDWQSVGERYLQEFAAVRRRTHGPR